MNQMYGMDLDQVENLARSFGSQAGHIDRIRFQIGAHMTVAGWTGRDAAAFTADWSRRLAPLLLRTAASLRSASDQLRAEVAQQRQASEMGPGGFQGWLADRFNDANEFIDDAKDFLGDVGDSLWDGVTTFADGVKDRAVATGVAISRHTKAILDVGGRTVDDLLNGRVPQISEVLAGGLLIYGTGIGVWANLIEGDDIGLLADRTVDPGSIRYENRDAPPAVNSTQDIAERALNDSYEENGIIITEVVKDGRTRYIVSIAGTYGAIDDRNSWIGGSSANDWSANLYSMATGRSAYSDAIEKIIRERIPPGSEILLQGHSQGGLASVNIASHGDFTKDYKVAGVVTYGAPVDCAPVPSDIPVMSVEAGPFGDPVAMADLGGHAYVQGPDPLSTLVASAAASGPQANITRVLVDDMGAANFDNHWQARYAQGLQNLSGEQQAKMDAYSAQIGLDNFKGEVSNEVVVTFDRQKGITI